MNLVLLLISLLFLSAFFSGTETAYFNLKLHRDSVPDHLKRMLGDQRKLLATLLTGNTVVNVVLASAAALFTQSVAQRLSWSESALIMIEVLIVSVVILIFGEILPKLLAIRKSVVFAGKAYYPLRFFTIILYPFVIVFYTLVEGLIRLLPWKSETLFRSEEELKILAEVSQEEGTIQSEESDMIQSIFDFRDKSVHEVMTPRVDMTALPSNASIAEIMDLINEMQYSKIPIYKKTIDDIKGIMYAKDLIPFITGTRPDVNLVSLSREPFFVPENKNLDELLEDFKQRKTNIAIVVDEWGGTAGLITLEDVVEEVIGEIRDPYDKEVSLLTTLSDNVYEIDGKMSIYDIEEEIELEFPEERDYDTLGGFLFNLIGDIPEVGAEVNYGRWHFIVKSLDGNRIDKVKIEYTDIISDRAESA